MVTLEWMDRKAFRYAGRAMLATLLLGMGAGTARASGPEDLAMDATALTQMEQRAESADVRDKCFLYAEIVQGLTDLAGREMAAGEDEQASATLRHVDDVSAKLLAATVENARRLQKAEEMMDRTTRHLSDMVHVASAQQRSNMQRTLEHLNAVHSQMLATVFAH
jgi:hypothetical protein